MKPDLDSAIDSALAEDLCRDDLVPGSVEIVREKHIGDDAVVAMTFRRRKKADVRRSCFGLAWSERHGWQTAGGSWASSVIERPPRGIWRNWGGWSSGSRNGLQVVSGWLAEPRAANLVVTDGQGRMVEDRVENGVAILAWRGAFSTERAVAELRDAAGGVLAREPLKPRRH